MRRVSYNQIRHSGELVLATGTILSLSLELTAWPNWKFYPIVLQLS